MSFILPSLIEKTNKCLINVIVTQHHRRPSTQTGRIGVCCSWFWVVLVGFVGFVGGFGWFCWWFWVVLGRFGWFWVVLGGFGWFRVLVTTGCQWQVNRQVFFCFRNRVLEMFCKQDLDCSTHLLFMKACDLCHTQNDSIIILSQHLNHSCRNVHW